LKEEEEDFV